MQGVALHSADIGDAGQHAYQKNTARNIMIVRAVAGVAASQIARVIALG
jgi:hypothetical protein